MQKDSQKDWNPPKKERNTDRRRNKTSSPSWFKPWPFHPQTLEVTNNPLKGSRELTIPKRSRLESPGESSSSRSLRIQWVFSRNQLARWWQLNYFLRLPRTLGEDEPNLTFAYFSNGLKENHQLANFSFHWTPSLTLGFSQVLIIGVASFASFVPFRQRIFWWTGWVWRLQDRRNLCFNLVVWNYTIILYIYILFFTYNIEIL